jgi:hypothetical protein
LVLAGAAAALVGASYWLGQGVGSALRVEERMTLEELEQAAPRLGRQIRRRFQPEAAYLGLSTMPCLVAYKERNPERRSVVGTVDFLVEIEGGRARVGRARAGGGAVDTDFAACARRAWEWAVPSYASADRARPFWLAVPVRLGLRASYPPLPEGWDDPERWQREGLASELPAAWRPVVADDLAARARLRSTPAPFSGCLSVTHPPRLEQHLPVFFEEIYESVFSPAAAQRFRQRSCAPSGLSTTAFTETLALQVTTVAGVARVRALGLGTSGPDPTLKECLLARIGLREGDYAVPGEADGEIALFWPIPVDASIIQPELAN